MMTVTIVMVPGDKEKIIDDVGCNTAWLGQLFVKCFQNLHVSVCLFICKSLNQSVNSVCHSHSERGSVRPPTTIHVHYHLPHHT